MPFHGPSLTQPVDLGALLSRGLGAEPEGLALVSREESETWRELDRKVDRVARGLLEIGLRPGDRVASLMPNRDALLIHYLACVRAGLVITPLNYRYMAPEIDHALEVSEASILFHHAERAADLEASRQVQRLRLGVLQYAAQPECSPSYEELVRLEPEPRELPGPKPGDPAAIFFTSGSTGSPKGVTHSFESLGWMFASLIGATGLNSDDVLLPGSSFSHLGAFMFSFAALSVGARIVVPRTIDADELLPLLREHRPTVLNVLPSPLFSLVRDHGAAHEDFASLRLVRAAGDKVSSELEREFTELAGFPIDEGYGMTETGVSALSPPSAIKPGSVGRPLPGFSFSIRDEEGNEMAPGAEGRVWVRSRSCTVGYWNKPEATREAMNDGWLDTGDLMRVDEEGYLWFCGRKKQIIVHDGSNICPQEVEEALLEHTALSGAAVVGVHDLLHGEDVRAYVSFREDAKRPTAQELIQFARARVGYKAPEEIVVLDEIPMTPTAKIDRVRLKAMAERDRAHP